MNIRINNLNHFYDGSKVLSDIDLEILKRTYDYPNLICESLDNYKFRQAINQLIDLSRMGNKYLADEEPWKLYKSGELERVQNIMFVSLQICGMLAILSEPFLPNASKKIREIINLKETKWTTLNIDQPILNSSNKINKPELIFRKIEDEEIQNQIDKLNN